MVFFNRYLDKARTLSLQRDWKKALNAVDSALFIVPESMEALRLKVEIMKCGGEFERAVELLEQILQRYRYWSWALLEISDLLINCLQRSKEAWTWLGRLRSCRYLSKEENNRFICLKASALIDQARFYEAQLCLHSGLQSSPNDISLLFLHSWVCLQRENYYCAANDYHKIIQLCPDYADAHYYLGWTYCALEAPRLMQNCFQLTYQLDSAKNQPLLFSRSDFQKLAEEALNKCFFWERGYSVQLAVEDLPPPSILDTYPYDPRKMGVFLQQPCFDPNAKKQPIGLLLIFQKNVERLLFTAKEIREGLMYFAHSEISGHPMFTIENTKDLRISNYGESS